MRKKTIQKQTAVTAEGLKSTLWETIGAVKTKKMNVLEANAISRASKEILSVVKLELQLYNATGSTKRSDVKELTKF